MAVANSVTVTANAFDANRDRLSDYGRAIFVPDSREGFALGRLVDVGADTITVELDGSTKLIDKIPYAEVLSAEENLTKDVEDNCALMYLNEATLLHNCRLRYENRKIYTYVANILISINPYETIPDLYSNEMIRAYEGKSLGTMPPHIFAIADRAYREMRRARISQSIVVSGESGAGKTESQKCVLRYLCHCWGSAAGPIEQCLLETNPILEAFGNAKTLRNNNSSRFGKFVEIHFNQKYEMAGGFVSHYLLEKTRVCAQQRGERNFHIFYQLLTDANAVRKFRLSTDAKHFNYLRDGCTQFFSRSSSTPEKNCMLDAVVDDALDYNRLCAALLDIGFSEAEREELLALLAGILHLGNAEFDEKSDDSKSGTRILPLADASLANAAAAFGLDVSQLRLGLTSRMMQPTKGGVKGTLIMVPLRSRECAAARDALAKSLYSRLFDTIVGRINSSIPFQSFGRTSFIGILDIAGFEFFQINSFEQFCINYCNEKLQQFFNDRILRQEQELYAKEGLNVPHIEFADNQDCIELFEQKSTGLLDLLDEEARLPKPSFQHFTLAVQDVHCKHPRIDTTRRATERRHRELRNDEAFLVRHYAATVCYETSAFLEKNNDALHDSLEMLLHESTNSLIKAFCAQSAAAESDTKTRAGTTRKSGKLNVASVGCKFRTQLLLLIEKLTNTGTHFVRCVKPNSQMAARNFAGAQILEQLKCAGMNSVLKLMHKGFPSRTSFSELYKMYEGVLPQRLARLDPRLFCKCLFHALGLNDSDYKFGMTKVFFRAGKFAEFDQLLRSDTTTMRALVERVNAWICRVRWRKLQYGVWSCIKLKNKILYRAAHLIRLQSALRGMIARKLHRRRIFALQKLTKLRGGVAQLREIAQKMHDASERNTWYDRITEFYSEIELITSKVKSDASLSADAQAIITNECAQLEKLFDTYLVKLKTQSESAERQRIQRLEAETKRQREAEDLAQKILMEQQKLIDERRQLEAQRQKVVEFETANKANQKQNPAIVTIPSNSLPYSTTQGTETDELQQCTEFTKLINSKQDDKYGIVSWTFAKLRDAINTSTNIEFLEACLDEFRRRLAAYRAWKAANEKANVEPSAPNAPPFCGPVCTPNSVLTTVPIDGTGRRIQRYFRVPFEKPIGLEDYSRLEQNHQRSAGFWYAHFDGQYIVRQMEIHPKKPPLLLVAGRDDEKMCELTLAETRLTHKKGAEILARDFDTLWTRHGGTPYRN